MSPNIKFIIPFSWFYFVKPKSLFQPLYLTTLHFWWKGDAHKREKMSLSFEPEISIFISALLKLKRFTRISFKFFIIPLIFSTHRSITFEGNFFLPWQAIWNQKYIMYMRVSDNWCSVIFILIFSFPWIYIN